MASKTKGRKRGTRSESTDEPMEPLITSLLGGSKGKKKSAVQSDFVEVEGDLVESKNFFSVGTMLTVKDKANRWRQGQVVDQKPNEILIHFPGWSFHWDEWIEKGSDRLASSKFTASNEKKHFEVAQNTCLLLKYSTTTQQTSGNKIWDQCVYSTAVPNNVTHEIEHREADLVTLQRDIEALMLKAQEGGEDADELGLELAKLLGVKGQHLRSVRSLLIDQRFVMSEKVKFTAQKAGLFRIVVRVNGTTNVASTDGVSIVVNKLPAAHTSVCPASGYPMCVHLHELVSMTVGDYFQIAQSFASSNSAVSADNSLFVESINHRVCRYSSTLQQITAIKVWNTVVEENKTLFTRVMNDTMFTASATGLYRIVVKICGSSTVNADHIAIQVGGVTIHRAVMGANFYHTLAAHLHEVISLQAGQSFQIYQSFNRGNLVNTSENTLFMEPVNPRICRYTVGAVQTGCYRVWQPLYEHTEWVRISSDGQTFTVLKSGQYRIVVKLTGSSAAATADHIALHINRSTVARSMIGLNSGFNISVHLHEVITLQQDDTVQIYQHFSGALSVYAMDNTLLFELLDALDHSEVKQEEVSQPSEIQKSILLEKLHTQAVPACCYCHKPFLKESECSPLGCGHIFCSSCIEDCSTLAGLRCQVCSRIFQKQATVELQITNVVKTAHICAERLLKAEEEVKEASPNAPPKCDECKKSEATLRSERLGAFLCEDCHLILSKYEVVRLQGVVKVDEWIPTVMCSIHNRPVELFCHEDQVLICLKCVATAHKGHLAEDPVTSFKTLVAPHVSEIKAKSVAQQEGIGTCLTKLSESREQLLSSIAVFPQIQNTFRDAHALLARREQNMLKSVEDHINRVQDELCDAQVGLLKSSSVLSQIVDELVQFEAYPVLPSMEAAAAFLSRLQTCQATKRCNFSNDLKMQWRPEPFDVPSQVLKMPCVNWESNPLQLLKIDVPMLVYQTTEGQVNGYKTWSHKLHMNKRFFKMKHEKCKIKQAGLYRVVVRVNASCAARGDLLALHVDQVAIARSYSGLNTGNHIAVHLHEVVSLNAGQIVQIHQQFSGDNLKQLIDNFMYIEALSSKVCRYSSTVAQNNGPKKWTTVQEEKSVCSCVGQNTFVVSETGLYRIVVRINGASTVNADQISIVSKGVPLHRAMVGLNSGYNIAAHLHEMVSLHSGESFQITADFNCWTSVSPNDNSLLVERINARICSYTAPLPEGTGFKKWQVVLEDKNWVTMSPDGKTFTIGLNGFYRIVVKINGTSNVASDHIALCVDGVVVARAMVGLSLGYQVAAHLHELVLLKSKQTFQIHQQFSHNSLGDTFNSLYVEKIEN